MGPVPRDMLLLLFAAVFAALVPIERCRAQCQGRWLYGPDQGLLGLSATATAVGTWDPDGAGPLQELLIAGGSFLGAGTESVNAIASWDGESWRGLGSGLSGVGGPANARVDAVTTLGQDLVVAGQFVSAGGVSAANIARWNGASWQPLGPGLNGPVRALVVYNNELYAGGQFSMSGAVPVANIAKWNGASWQPVDGGVGGAMSPPVAAMTVFGGDLIVGGAFESAGGNAAIARIARWNVSTGWSSMGVIASGSVYSLAVHNGQLFAAGLFFAPSGCCILRWNSAAWVQAGNGVSDTIHALASFGGDLYVAGVFTTAGGVSCRRIARLNSAINQWQPVGTGIDGYTTDQRRVDSLVAFRGLLVAAGPFTLAGDSTALRVAAWDGTSWRSLGRGLDSSIMKMAAFENDVVAAGHFLWAGLAPATRIARWTGRAWHPVGAGFNELPAALLMDGGALFAGGYFTRSGQFTTDRAAVWNASMDAWLPMGGGLSGGPVHALAPFEGGIVAGGQFLFAGGVPAANIARWDGSSWQPMGGGMNGTVYALTVFDGTLYAAGAFTTAGGSAANRVARWNAALSQWQAVGAGLNDEARCLAVHNGELFVGGIFTQAAGTPAARVAKWNGAWSPAGGGIASGTVTSLASYRGSLYAGGTFLSPAFLARLNETTGVWQGVAGGVGANVFSLLVHRGELLVGGEQTTAGGRASAMLARWTDTFTPWIATQPAPVSTGSGMHADLSVALAHGYESAVVTYQWRRNGIPITDGPGGASPGGGFVVGASAPTLTIYNARPLDGGDYSCVVSSPCGGDTSNAAALTVAPACGSADFDGDGDTGTDADIQAFFACMSGDCCPFCGSVDFDGDGDTGTDADIQAFFLVLAGGAC